MAVRKTRRRYQPDDGPPVYTPSKRRSDSENDGPLSVPEGYTAPYVRDLSGMSPRGVEGWTAAGAGTGTIGQRRPSYYEDDVFRPATLNPASIGQLQGALAAAGLLGDFRYGIWDESSQSAYRDLLGEANAAGLSAMAMLQQRAASVDMPSGTSGSGGGHWEMDGDGNPTFVNDPYVAPPLELQLPNKTDVATVLRRAVIDELGEGWTQEQINELADDYIARVRGVQTDAHNQRTANERAEWEGASTGGGTITSVAPPTMEAFAEEELRRRDPEGVELHDAVGLLMGLIDGNWSN